MAKVRKPSLHDRLVAYKKRSRARDVGALASGKISAEELFKRNFFFEGLDFSKVRIIRAASRMVHRIADDDRHRLLVRLLRREIGNDKHLTGVRWINVDTAEGNIRALAFWAEPRDLKFPIGNFSLEMDQNRRKWI